MIRTALLSYGMSGEIFHAPFLKAHPDFELTAVLERRSARSKERYPDTQLLKSVEAIASHPEIQLVVVNTPNPTHYEFTKMMLEAGKHVVVEKPFTNTKKEADALIRLAKEKGALLTVFQNRRWDGDFMTIRQVVESGLLGELVEFEGHYDRYRPLVEGGTWKEEAGPGSGILYNLGSHMIDQALVLFGRPKAVTADIRIQRAGSRVPDNYEVILDYDALKATLKSGYLVREQGPRYILYGRKGSFIKSGIDPQEQALKDGLAPGSRGWGVEEEDSWGLVNTEIGGLHYRGRVETLPGNYLTFYDDLSKAIRLGQPLPVPPEEAALVIEVIEAALESAKLQKTVSLRHA